MADIKITISGPQGAGKTALQDLLHELLESVGLKVTHPNRPHSKTAMQILASLDTSISIETVQDGQ